MDHTAYNNQEQMEHTYHSISQETIDQKTKELNASGQSDAVKQYQDANLKMDALDEYLRNTSKNAAGDAAWISYTQEYRDNVTDTQTTDFSVAAQQQREKNSVYLSYKEFQQEEISAAARYLTDSKYTGSTISETDIHNPIYFDKDRQKRGYFKRKRLKKTAESYMQHADTLDQLDRSGFVPAKSYHRGLASKTVKTSNKELVLKRREKVHHLEAEKANSTDVTNYLNEYNNASKQLSSDLFRSPVTPMEEKEIQKLNAVSQDQSLTTEERNAKMVEIFNDKLAYVYHDRLKNFGQVN